jgi:hypothetical protein
LESNKLKKEFWGLSKSNLMKLICSFLFK